MTTDINSLLSNYTQQVDAQLELCLPVAEGPAQRLHAAMRYAVFNGGKRLRPALCFAAAEAVGQCDTNTAKVAAALELIHAYSLIHDDLPAMDDDDLRRGLPSCHIQFDEATAILAGDALQSLAFAQLTELNDIAAQTSLRLIALLSDCAGYRGMVGGQAIDLAATGHQLDVEQLQTMHAHKTGALIEASVLMGAMATGAASKEHLAALSQYAKAIGLAFQIQDDILDVESTTQQLGKLQGSDRCNNKSTYRSILGLESARAEAAKRHQQSLDALGVFADGADSLTTIANFIVQRHY